MKRGCSITDFIHALPILVAAQGLVFAPTAWALPPTIAQAAAGDRQDDAAIDAAAGPRTLGQRIAERDGARLAKARQTKKVGGILAAAAGIGTAFVCGAGKRGASTTTQLLCTAAGAAVAYTATMITNAIAKKLVEKDQKQVLAAAGESLKTGEPQQLALPDSHASASVVSSGQPVLREATVSLFYDTVRVADLNKITVIAEPYVVTRANTVLRSAPAVTAKASGKLAANQPLYVSGQVDRTDWYLVSERVVEGQDSAMMAVGYVEAKQLKPAPAGATMAGSAPPRTMASKDVLAVLKCDTVGFTVRDAKGKETNGTSELCRGPEGTPISA